jgi:membrane protein implicated in regulation of membrane protease activity
MLYFLHHVLVLTIAHEWLGLKLDSWWWYALANVLLTIVLVYLGRLWLEIRSMAARRLQTA